MRSGFVAILGQPNVGKSTLLNRLMGESLAIVTPKPQTTRQNIKGILNRDDAQVVFLDTPGFHRAGKALNRFMLDRIGEAIESADVALLVVEPKKAPDGADLAVFRRISGIEKKLIVVNKIDTVIAEPYGMVVERYWKAFGGTPTIAVSAKSGEWCGDLLNKVVELLPEGGPFYPEDDITEHTVRFLASEMIREQAMLLLKQEVPYSLAVDIAEFREGPTTKVRAYIVVEKESQKGIVIGAGGRMIKEIGTRARERIEALTGTKVFLELHVKVQKDWTNDPSGMKKLGYG